METSNQVNGLSDTTQIPTPRTFIYTFLVFTAFLNVLVAIFLYFLIYSLLTGTPIFYLLKLSSTELYDFIFNIPILFFYFLETLISSWIVWLLFKKKWRVSFRTILCTFILMFALSMGGFKIYNQTKLTHEIAQYPVKLSMQNYDFTKPILISDRESTKNNITLENNKIVWLEDLFIKNTRTGEYESTPPQVFTFIFNEANSTGEIVQASDNHNNSLESIIEGNVKIYDGVIYWAEGQGALVQYDTTTKQRKVLIDKGVKYIDSIYKNNLLYENGSELHFINIKTGEISGPVALVAQPYGGVYSSQYVCYYTIDSRLERFNLQTRELTKLDLPKPQADLYYNPYINQCDENFIGYSISPKEANFGKSIEWYIYDFSTKQNTLLKRLPTFSGNFIKSKGKIFNNIFYYMGSDQKIYAMDLTTKQEKILASSDTGKIGDWQTDGKYLVYTININLSDNRYKNNLFLLKLAQ